MKDDWSLKNKEVWISRDEYNLAYTKTIIERLRQKLLEDTSKLFPFVYVYGKR